MGHTDWTKEPDLELLRRAHGLLTRNREQALVELKALADRGSVMSMLYIANAYRDGKSSSDLAQAEEWYRRAMNCGSLLGSYELGRVYYELKNYPKAEEAFRVGEKKNYAPSLHMLAFMHLNGVGAEKNISKARDLLERASASGHVFARRKLAGLLIKGGNGPRQFFRGVRLLFVSFKDIFAIVFRDPYDDRLR